jgi:peroxiredoxin
VPHVFAFLTKEKKMVRSVVAVLLSGVILAGTTQLAGAQTTKLKIGDPAPNFTNLPGVDGKKHSLTEYKDKDVLVVAITCNHCPVAVAYEDRIINFTKKYAGKKVQVIAINVNTSDADKLEAMVVRAKGKGFNFPYLYDASQMVARDLNARVTPEFYVFDKSRKLVYWGSMDNKQDPAKVTTNYLEPAVDAALAGKAVTTAVTKAFGCSVQYE